uniref:Ribosomal protein S4 n=1 Tax=Trieres regia TaxID=1335017 RepID=A0A7T5BN83_9STRA|nr:ribosomal protein S4 [Odontella regia]QQD79310.1 ribosomal protein S4 [Odontella regia]
MFSIKNRRYKSIYKKYIKLKEINLIQDKMYSFKRKKWVNFFETINRILNNQISYRLTSEYNKYIIPTYTNNYKNRFKETLLQKLYFQLFLKTLPMKYFKTLIKRDSNLKNSKNNFFKTQVQFFNLLNSRLDMILFRAFFVKSPRHAAQLIKHSQVLINKQIITNVLFKLKPGDIVEVIPKRHSFIKRNVEKLYSWPLVPKYIEVNFKTLQIYLSRDIKDVNVSKYATTNRGIDILNLKNIYLR